MLTRAYTYQVFEELYALKNKCVATATSKPYIKAIVGGKEISIEELNVSLSSHIQASAAAIGLIRVS